VPLDGRRSALAHHALVAGTLDAALGTLAARARSHAFKLRVDGTLRDRAANGRYAWTFDRGQDFAAGIWVIDPVFMVDTVPPAARRRRHEARSRGALLRRRAPRRRRAARRAEDDRQRRAAERAPATPKRPPATSASATTSAPPSRAVPTTSSTRWARSSAACSASTTPT
jgi:hypothetical protein